jgi:proteasome lid subunit RPN8/RPN11
MTSSVLRDLMSSAKRVYPYEFIAMLGVSSSRPDCISEVVVLPAEFGEDFSEIRSDLIPFDPLIVGTVHSHPDAITRPSPEDRNVFSRLGKVHLILGHPYDARSFSAYDSRGRKIRLAVE